MWKDYTYTLADRFDIKIGIIRELIAAVGREAIIAQVMDISLDKASKAPFH
jgi:hypothetical protein